MSTGEDDVALAANQVHRDAGVLTGEQGREGNALGIHMLSHVRHHCI
jgi:hypothetical protein